VTLSCQGKQIVFAKFLIEIQSFKSYSPEAIKPSNKKGPAGTTAAMNP
jgi:hypothetical protein